MSEMHVENKAVMKRHPPLNSLVEGLATTSTTVTSPHEIDINYVKKLIRTHIYKLTSPHPTMFLKTNSIWKLFLAVHTGESHFHFEVSWLERENPISAKSHLVVKNLQSFWAPE